MTSGQFFFYFIAAVIVVFSLLAVTSRRILRAAVYLLISLAGTAAVYFILGFNFLAAVQLIVYAGGIVVLIIFSILLTSQISDKLESPGAMKIMAAAAIAVIGLGVVGYVLQTGGFRAPGPATQEVGDVGAIGEALLSYDKAGYVLPFEVISILLLAAMVGAIAIVKRRKAGS
jgi:NADH-quinone oxidoreductase subunit J